MQSNYLYTPNAELDEGTEHLPTFNLISGTTDRNFHEQAVVMRLEGVEAVNFKFLVKNAIT